MTWSRTASSKHHANHYKTYEDNNRRWKQQESSFINSIRFSELMAYQQRCIACKKNMVLITFYTQRPVCVQCEMKDISDPIENPKWKKFFDIDTALYEKSSFLRSIKRNYFRQETLTPKQKEMFLKVVKEGAQGRRKKTKDRAESNDPTRD